MGESLLLRGAAPELIRRRTKTTSLYICYQSIRDPLTQTQVVAYLQGLALAGYGIVLLTFETQPMSKEDETRWRTLLACQGIVWYWLRYHKHPTVSATGWDICSGIAMGARLIRRHNVQLVHARAHVPGMMGLALKHLTRVKMLFDVRGLMAEEFADAGMWRPNGPLFRLTKGAERFLVKAADGIVVLNNRTKLLFERWYATELKSTPVEVIPCCVSTKHTRPFMRRGEARRGRRSRITFVYVGKLGGWYPVEDIVSLVAEARRSFPDLRFQVWSQSNTSQLTECAARAGLADCVTVGKIAPRRLLERLQQADVALALYRRDRSAAACSPTKIGEYLAAGLPVVCSAGIGDMDTLLAGSVGNGSRPVGVLLSDHTPAAYKGTISELARLVEDPAISLRCHDFAKQHFDMETVGWQQYRKLYQELLGFPQ